MVRWCNFVVAGINTDTDFPDKSRIELAEVSGVEKPCLHIKHYPLCEYQVVWQAMKNYALLKNKPADELWVLQHHGIYTRGIRCKEFPVSAGERIPLISTDRGGLMTYHGPGQLILYGLIDLKRKSLNIKQVVNFYEQLVINTLSSYGVEAARLDGAPGVYVDGCKIASIGIRVKNNTTYHGLSVNLDMDLKPFEWINTCGFKKLDVVQLKNYVPNLCIKQASEQLVNEFTRLFDYQKTSTTHCTVQSFSDNLEPV